MKTEIRLGSKVRCNVTGLTGIAVTKLICLNGCEQYGVQSTADKKTGAVPDTRYIDSEQLCVIGNGVIVPQDKTGGPSNRAPSYAGR